MAPSSFLKPLHGSHPAKARNQIHGVGCRASVEKSCLHKNRPWLRSGWKWSCWADSWPTAPDSIHIETGKQIRTQEQNQSSSKRVRCDDRLGREIALSES